MKIIIFRLIVSLLAFAIGSSVAILWTVYSQSVDVPAPLVETIFDVDFLDLAENPELYVGKTVRVRTVMYGSSLGEHFPNTPFTTFGYDFAPNSEEAWNKVRPIFEDNTPYIPHRSEPCKRVRITAIGKVIEDKNKTRLGFSFPFWLMIQSIENVEPCPRLWFHDA